MKIIKEENQNVLLVLTEKEDVSEKVLKSNDVDAAFEKHVPQYQKKDNQVEVFVNHVMEEEHYIEWILVEYEKETIIKRFVPSSEPKVVVPYEKGMKAYAYCNKHSLWKGETLD